MQMNLNPDNSILYIYYVQEELHQGTSLSLIYRCANWRIMHILIIISEEICYIPHGFQTCIFFHDLVYVKINDDYIPFDISLQHLNHNNYYCHAVTIFWSQAWELNSHYNSYCCKCSQSSLMHDIEGRW